MGLIYWKATEVIAWLGIEADGSSDVIEVIRKMTNGRACPWEPVRVVYQAPLLLPVLDPSRALKSKTGNDVLRQPVPAIQRFR